MQTIYPRKKASGENALQTNPVTETVSPEMIVDQNAKIREQALQKGKAKGIELDTAEKLLKVTGLKLQYIYEEGSGVDGFISGDTVTVNLASDTSAFCVVAHEVGHSMKIKNAEKFAAFQASVQRIIENTPELKQYADQIRADYTAENSPALASLTNADGTINTAALEEDVCLKTFERLIEDPERLAQAVAHDRSAIESFLDVLRGIKNSLVIKFTGSEKAMLDEAERAMVNLLRGEAGIVESTRFSNIGEHAKLNNKQIARLEWAKRMEREGKPDIKRITGWHLAPDGEWRWEIDDSKAQFYPNGDARGSTPRTHAIVRDYIIHPELDEAEPGLFDMPVQIDPTIEPDLDGLYFGLNKGIVLSPSAGKPTMLHELTHGIQDLEGFADGSNMDWGRKWALIAAYDAAKVEPEFQTLTTKEMRFEYLQNKAMELAEVNTFDDAAYRFYAMAAGEVEARDVESRAHYDASARQIIDPDMSGNVLYAENPNSRYIDLMKKYGILNNIMERRCENEKAG